MAFVLHIGQWLHHSLVLFRLLMELIFNNETEFAIGFLDHEVALVVLCIHCWMLHREFDHVPDVDRQPFDVVGVA